MFIFDSAKKIKREFIPQEQGKVSLYVCGPTVYDDAHLGHAKSALVFDLLCRVLNANGYEVTYARNITDIDDKIINRAQEQNKTIKEVTDFYTDAYHKEMALLGISRPDIEPKATESLDAMYALVQKLLDNKHAYTTDDGDVYFDTSSDSKYLTLSNRVQDESEKLQRVQSSSQKRNPADFALWKSIHDESVTFGSPFGKGRPGWHLECSAMIEKHLSKPNAKFAVDIHGGGADLLFPHHENEAAQTRCATDHALAAYWMHNGFVNIDGEKMSKSLGNSFFLKDALKIYDGEVLRFYLLSTHYRSNFNFNEEDLATAKKRLDKIYRLKKRLFGVTYEDEKTDFKKELLETLSDDLNISASLALIEEMITRANETLDTAGKHKELKREALSNLSFIEKILGFGIKNPYEYFQFGVNEETKTEIAKLIEKRAEAKKSKDFAASDMLRDKILAYGVNLMDTPQGSFWEKI
ncbi:cysteinyl-tRNA synthetase [Sulfurimonas denitrificans DSM 1251]|uniref:Cysteine--tRNA ligase n=1 Tax=Sulfurimonas denitrificans (strain ATCC 33889 / DSM 1251) TaxID=326298 RepID=SYC_SULDN|nr:cysteine--tRNA ligase [Sulfurimonas denitrificans]Q30R91.1 RecName: Full=Cysteine--tRNA ligase; AltName: Full=Cysteinyl-tRNA synthetase; Short=CysRS [Sulfurimonas denitrificans DSM 1251]ABB44490.1 cysteinyl-tRNA synthetase [Sulfurimonas denitrificans DSM 1251]MDD3441672.1 cysteine--tRNA ligase [Sulfurimonas denitrificans]